MVKEDSRSVAVRDSMKDLFAGHLLFHDSLMYIQRSAQRRPLLLSAVEGQSLVRSFSERKISCGSCISEAGIRLSIPTTASNFLELLIQNTC